MKVLGYARIHVCDLTEAMAAALTPTYKSRRT